MLSDFFKKLLQEFIYGGHLLSLGAACIVWTVIILSGETVSQGWPILVLAYLSSQIVYNHDHLDELNDLSANSERSRHLVDTKRYQTTTLLIYISLLIIISFYTTFSAALLAIFIALGGVFYTKKAKNATKKIIGFKNIYIAFFWSILAFLVPLHYSHDYNNPIFLTISLFIFIRWIVNSAFFDIKDLKEDKAKGLKTLPAIFGFDRTITYLHAFNFLSGLVLLFSVFTQYFPAYSLVLLVFPIYSYVYLRKASGLTSKQLRMVSYVVVDGEYILWPFVLLLGRVLAA